MKMNAGDLPQPASGSERHHSPAFKSAIALAAIRGHECDALARQYGLKSEQVIAWKREILSRAPELFSASPLSPDRSDVLKVLHMRLGSFHWRMVLWRNLGRGPRI